MVGIKRSGKDCVSVMGCSHRTNQLVAEGLRVTSGTLLTFSLSDDVFFMTVLKAKIYIYEISIDTHNYIIKFISHSTILQYNHNI